MTISTELIGRDLPPAPFAWQETDVILYALGIGARPPEELDVLYEARGPEVIPTFALIANWWAVRDLRSALGTSEGTMVHAAQALEVHRDIPPSGAVQTRAAITALWDKGRNTVIEVTGVGTDDDGPLFTARSTTMLLGVGGWGGDRGPGRESDDLGERSPDCSIDDVIRPEQSAIYRLSGDRNPLHIDPEPAKAAGFDDVFLHGLCTLGFAARAIIRSHGGGHPSRLRSIACRFAAPVMLDTTIRTEIWSEGDGAVRFRTVQGERDALSSGTAVVEG